jgi:peptidoglycan/LPS O-acetylase OafA/YrhL
MINSNAYRADIDGLRALAVIAVILFHAEISLGPVEFRGGFLGVDVFFVISGFLITSTLRREFMETGRVSISHFYERRVRRIAPAMVLVFLLSFLAAQFILLPHELGRFSQSLLAAIAFVANVFFWLKNGYFSPAADQQPLLHMWSLAVEEQYYLLFPLAFWALVRWSDWRIATFAIAATAVFSAILHMWGSLIMQSASFYLTPFRVWELLAGAILAMSVERIAGPKPGIATLLGVLGSALILSPMILYDPFDSTSVFPVTLATVIGSCLIIAAGPHGLISVALSWKPFVGIGLMSFSLYLVHQPLFAFARVRTIEEPSQLLMLGLALICFPLAYLSWRFVEVPFRQRQWIGNKIFYLALSTSIALLVATSIGSMTGRFSQRWSLEAIEIAESVNAPTNGLSATCDGIVLSADCVTGDAPRTLLWGDSFAMHLAPGLVARGISFRQVTKRACAPSTLEETRAGDTLPLTQTRISCEKFNANVLALAAAEAAAGRLDSVIISSRDYGLRSGSLRLTPSERNLSPERVGVELDVILSQLRAMGLSVGVVSAPPPADFDPGDCYLRRVAYNDHSSDCTFAFPPEHAVYPLLHVSLQNQGSFLDVSKVICANGLCSATQNDRLIYRDNGHLTPGGAEFVMQSEPAQSFLERLGLFEEFPK